MFSFDESSTDTSRRPEMKLVENMLDRVRPTFDKDKPLGFAWPVFEALETFFLTPSERTHQGAHVRDTMDMKRLMIFVDFALIPAILMGCYSVGYHGYLYEGMAGADGGVLGPIGWLDYLMRGAWHFLPLYIVTMSVGGVWELLFAVVRKHEINEGFLVTGLLFPLTLPPTIPLWMVAMGISFGIVIGKEVFGGVGMNILNPALTARAFVFFTYPAFISGARDADGYGVWDSAGAWSPLAWFNGTSSGAEASSLVNATAVDGYSGATPLLAVSSAGDGTRALDALAAEGWSWLDMFLGFTPGSIGETSALACLIGGVILIATGIGSWRIMLGGVLGLLSMGAVFYFFVGGGMPGVDPVAGVNPMFTIPPWYHLVMGSFAFGIVFMATDPVSGTITPWAQLLYGIFIGVLIVLVRVVNPAYPEGVMLAILFMNVFAPLLDWVFVQRSMKRRAARMAAA
jgi:Na+-transporting NADH:ubiquinone oxidoreductase subunit B